MSTTLHSFIDIFDAKLQDGDHFVQLQKIVIPIIQRDYAQGRLDDDATRVRSRFLASLYQAVVNNPITLDFVYGDIDENGIMTPLDGQQRLTTLFLLHWYAAKKEDIPNEECAFLKKFSYETRYSARDFCDELIKFKPTFNIELSKEIINQAWFPLDWKKDPTIHSMLVMLDAIDDCFKNVDNIWDKLKNKTITFYFLPIKDMGLTDELYIKMNSRGKPLTLFEHFKAEFERELRAIDEKIAQSIVEKIDKKWTDLLWMYRNSNVNNSDDNVIDDEFLRYFAFVCDIIRYRNGESLLNDTSDAFALVHKYFSLQCPNATDNIKTVEAFFDCWCDIEGYNNPTEFLKSFMCNKHEKGKITVDSKIDIFEDCVHYYSDKTGRIRAFPLNRMVLLYAITIYLQNRKMVAYSDFLRRIRIINNLILNSEDEISDRQDRNRIPAILHAVDSIILFGEINESIENNFNINQIKEEKEKIDFLKTNPTCAEELFALEDHPLLKGQVSVIGLKHLDYRTRFESLFKCDWDKVDCALMATGNYGQQERNGWRYQYGSKITQSAWDALFHRSANVGFEKTSNVLLNLLATNITFDDTILDKIIMNFTENCESRAVFPWEYYYVKYPSFRPGSYGKMCNTNAGANPYLFSVMQTRSQLSENAYIPYFKEADAAHLDRDSLGQQLLYADCYITCLNNVYIVNKTGGIIEKIEILQNSEKIDTEDRIIKLKNYLSRKSI